MSSSGATEEEMEIPEGYAEIVVVRHGETSWNASRILQGHLDPELNENGRQQAAAVANRLSKEPKFNAIYSSDLKRAAETAQIIANQCDLKEVILDQQLRERNLGDLQGLTLVDAQKMKPNVYKDFLSHKIDQEIPGGGESLDQLHQRCVSSFRKIANQHRGERVIVVSHGGFIRELHRKAAPNRKLEGKIQNTSVNVILISASKNHWFIKKWGDTSHLQGIGALDSGFGGDKTSG
ncbi:phosphoglycerate mutase-like protein 4 [Carex littledalei]|uniref:Phosphoglycerate mutase-like protein 4 n=1 Tax=Carex littledalei TaxID=544730 RepID=A0A833RH73_9POAL|nr:phosphoglycerate mutase-like protein 4 [Carex littledalei]